MSPNLAGPLLMMGSMASFTLNDAMIKMLTERGQPVFQTVFLRGLCTTLVLLVVARMIGAGLPRLAGPDRWRLGWRTGFEVAAMAAFLTALVNMPLANATAILSALPLAVTLGAALWFAEPVGWRRLTAILIGAIGVTMIIQPTGDGFNAYSLLALLAVVFVAGRDLVTRRISGAVPVIWVAVLTAVAVGIFGGVLRIGQPFVPLGAAEIGLLALSVLFIIGGYTFSVAVMRVGDVSLTAPFRYSALIFALVVGYLLFGDWPNGLALAGAGVVMAAGVFTLIRERQVSIDG